MFKNEYISRLFKVKYVFILVLLVAAVIRFLNVDYPMLSDEPVRDYIVARHITKYSDFVRFGPNNGTLPSFGNSPSYSYILASFVVLKDDIMFLTFVNMFLQVCSLFLIYLAVKKVLGPSVALTTLTLIGFSSVFILMSFQIWQPYIMFFFLSLSFYLLTKGFEKKNNSILVLSGVTLAISLSVHMSVIAFLPFYFLSALTLNKPSIKPLYILVTAFIVTLTFLYLPLFAGFTPGSGSKINILEISDLPANFFANLQVFLSSLNLSSVPLIITITTFLIYFMHPKVSIRQIKISGVMIIGILFFLIISSVSPGARMTQHFYPVFALSMIFLAELINKVYLNKHKIPGLIVIGIFIFFFFGNTRVSLGTMPKLQAETKIVNIIKNEILEIRMKETNKEISFFQFKIYKSPGADFYTNDPKTSDAYLWSELEKELDKKFVRVYDNGRESAYEVLNSGQYIFVVCQYYREPDDCKNTFLKENNNYTVIKKLNEEIYDQAFFLAKIK